MNWNQLYDTDNLPSFENIYDFTGQSSKLLKELCIYIEETYKIKPQMSYSKCCAQPGWNVKYHKGSKSLCTIYPMEGYFIVLVVVGAKEETEVEFALNSLENYTAELYRKTAFSCGGRWLMISVRDDKVLNDIKKLINIRVNPK